MRQHYHNKNFIVFELVSEMAASWNASNLACSGFGLLKHVSHDFKKAKKPELLLVFCTPQN